MARHTEMIALRGVSKHFGRHQAVQPLDLLVPRGALWGLLGHNGAGKSTLIGMMLGQVFPDGGSVRIDGEDVFRKRTRALARVGAIFETPGFYPYLSGLRNLRMFSEYTGKVTRERLLEAARLAGIEEALGDPVQTYSCGMRQRLALAQALLPEPELLILDEPGNGLDPEGFRDLRDMLRRLHEERGLTILLSSHLLAEVEQLCSHVSILHRGRLVFDGAWSADEGGRVEFRADRQEVAERGLIEAGIAQSIERPGRVLLCEGRDAADVAEWLVTNGFRPREIRHGVRSLEDFYLSKIHEPDREER